MRYNSEQQEAFEAEYSQLIDDQLIDVEEYQRAKKIIELYKEMGVPAFICVYDEKADRVITAHSLCLVANQKKDPHNWLFNMVKTMAPQITGFVKNFNTFFLK